MIRAMLFDFSGTLAHCGDAWWSIELHTAASAALRLLRQQRGLPVTDAELTRADALFNDLHVAARSSAVEISAQDAVASVAAELGVQAPGDALAEAVDAVFRTCLPDVAPADGALETLHGLQGRGLRLGVISNARHGAYVRWALERLGFLAFFQTVVVSADVRLRKPQPAIFLDTCAVLGVAPAQAGYTGDFYPQDMVGARAAGLRSIWLTDEAPDADRPADLVIRRLPELLPWVDRMLLQR